MKIGPLDLRRAHRIVASWPKWKRDLAERVLRPSYPPYRDHAEKEAERKRGGK